jgi:hypothetical protein
LAAIAALPVNASAAIRTVLAINDFMTLSLFDFEPRYRSVAASGRGGSNIIDYKLDILSG